MFANLPLWLARFRVVDIRFLAFLLLVVVVAGCRPLGSTRTPPPPPSSGSGVLPSAGIPAGSATLEIAVVTIPWPLVEDFEKVWGQADTQFLDLETRRMLDRNGIRCAALGTRLPGELTRLLEWTPPISDGSDLAQPTAPPGMESANGRTTAQLQQLQPGAAHWVACSPPQQHLNWFTETGSGQRKTGICFNAQCGINIGMQSADDGTVRLWLQPEVQHGQLRLRYGIDENDFLLESRQDRFVLRELKFDCRLLPGQTLMVACTRDQIVDPADAEETRSPQERDGSLWPADELPLPGENEALADFGPCGAGRACFGNYPDRSQPARFLVIRPVFIQADDLFQTGSTQRRLTTRLD